MESVIEIYCMKKIVLANPLLPFGTIGEAHAHCIYLQKSAISVIALMWHHKYTIIDDLSIIL